MMKKIFQELLDDIEDFENTAEGVGYDLRLDLSDIIYRHLASRGWTQKRLAEAAGMKSPLLTRVMHSASNCTFDTAGRILFALGIKGKLVEVVGNASEPSQPVRTPATMVISMIEETKNGRQNFRQYSTESCATCEIGKSSRDARSNVA